jgi:DNA polymerase elongation subunit (family B)
MKLYHFKGNSLYIDCFFDKNKNKVFVSEIKDGRTILQEYEPELFFYIEDDKGKYVSTFGDRLAKIQHRDYKKFTSDLRRYRGSRNTYEGDIKPLFKTLERHYQKQRTEFIKKSYYDIETEMCKERGYAPTDDPFNRITAFSVYNNWEETLYSLSLRPKGMTMKEAETLLEDIPNNIICDSEEMMIMMFLELIKDSNVLAGWNSRWYDLPYVINRMRKIMGQEAVKKLCLWNQNPIMSTVEKYGQEQTVYDLIGRVHLDMLELYQKYTYNELPTYRLDYVGELEVGENKVPYEGTLDQLYNNDYRKFIDYSRQDTMLLYKLDKKLDHINLVFKIAHENLVDVKTTMGAVALSDNALVLEAHRRDMRVPDRKRSLGGGSGEESKIAGAWVASPQKGFWKWIGSVDLTSLYPSIFRAFNLGNETIVGQILHTKTDPLIKSRVDSGMTFAEAWHDIFWIEEVDDVLYKKDNMLVLRMEDGEKTQLSAKDIHTFVFENNFIITANGTIIRTDKQSIISSLLERWFNERVEFQKKAKVYQALTVGIELPPELLEKLQEG